MRDLEGISMLEGLNTEEKAWAGGRMSVRPYKKGRLIFMEGEPADFVGFVLSGRVKLYRMSEEGQERVIHLISAGDVFGEVPFLDNGTHPLTAEAAEETRIAIINHADLRALLERNPCAQERLLAVLSLRLRQTYRQIHSMTFKDAYARTAGRIFKLARDHGAEAPKGVTLEITITHSELASWVGASRETVTKIVNDLERQGILQVLSGHLTILDMEKLRRYC